MKPERIGVENVVDLARNAISAEGTGLEACLVRTKDLENLLNDRVCHSAAKDKQKAARFNVIRGSQPRKC